MAVLQKPTLLTEHETAGMLRLSPGTLREWRIKRRPDAPFLPYVKLGRRVFYEPEAVRSFISRGRRGARQTDKAGAA